MSEKTKPEFWTIPYPIESYRELKELSEKYNAPITRIIERSVRVYKLYMKGMEEKVGYHRLVNDPYHDGSIKDKIKEDLKKSAGKVISEHINNQD
ncbi:hypothetical protein P9265_15450 [Schinkia azotoformans]|uniref:hypothetical protein n=1 Tax=Schinkia azotoformans TaxID=1454 RepID=UPI002E21A353|nr:hypothetical protein [Schinkia azotoformans]